LRLRLILPAALGLFLVAAVVGQRSQKRKPEQAYSVQMHLHGPFSEGSGSIAAHTSESRRVGLDALWWSDHDWRIEAYRHCSRFSFDAQHERLDKDENWSAIINSEANATKGLTQSRMGALSAHSVQIDTARKLEGLASLALSATSAQASFQELDYLLSAQRSRFLRPLASGVTLGISVFPETAGPDAHAYIEVQLSQHPDPNVPPRTNYRIRYVFTPTPSAPTRVRELYTVPVAVTSGTWNTLVLPITQDAEFGFAPSDGDDNVLHDLFFGVEARNGATARVNFDALVVSEQIAPADRLALQASLLQAKFGAEPDIAQFQGIEISFIGEHLNEYSLAPVLPDYEALFLASGLLNGQGQISDPLATANYVSAQAVAAVHARGGVVSYNHVFGTNTLPSPATPTKEQVLSKLLANELYGADVMEVGYRQRGRSLSEHLWVWDQLALAGRFVTGTGVSDSHTGYAGEYRGQGNTLVSWIWARSRARADLLEGLAHGRVFFGDIAFFDGDVELTASTGVRMGDIALTQAASISVSLSACGLAAGDQVRWIVSGQLLATTIAAGSKHTETRSIPLHAALPTSVRIEVFGPGGEEKVFSNPLTFVRTAPLRPTPRFVRHP
jgi:hypothetical protein